MFLASAECVGTVVMGQGVNEMRKHDVANALSIFQFVDSTSRNDPPAPY